MLKVSVVCHKEYTSQTLSGLRELGILHVRQAAPPSAPELASLSQDVEKITVLVNSLGEFSKLKSTWNCAELSPVELADTAIAKFNKLNENKRNLEFLKKDIAKLLPWGDFSFDTIKRLKEKGFFVYLCVGMMSNVEACREKGAVEIICREKETVYFIVIAEKEQQKNELPLAPLPTGGLNLNKLNAEAESLKNDIAECINTLAGAAGQIDKIKKRKSAIEGELEFFTNKSGMGEFNELNYITGFIPDMQKEILSDAAQKNGWAVLFEEPDEADRAPTLLNVPKAFRCILPIFDFIGIYPGYFEWDVSLFFLFFFTIFYSIILGDAGYGLVFLAACIFFKFKAGKDNPIQNTLTLVIVLSLGTTAWGLITSSIFGIPEDSLPHWLSCWRLHYVEDPGIRNQNIQQICFLLGALHLSGARLYKAWIHRGKLKALGDIGWAMFIWANYFMLVKLVAHPEDPLPGITQYLYIVGAILVLVFYVHWTDIGSIFHTPFSFIGSFVDVLSYIRLFAVWLAGAYIIICFMSMAKMVAAISPFCIVFAVLIMVFAHLLNIALALMAVLVHGVRLNTLEFSNQMGLEWAGIAYKPFKKSEA